MKYLNVVFLLLIASISQAQFTITLSTTGAKSSAVVISSPTGISSSSFVGSFTEQSTVTLTATSASTATFAGWAGEAGCHTNLPTCAVVMTDSRTVTAKFNSVLAVSLYGNGSGTVTDASGTINCSITNACSNNGVATQSYSSATHVTLTATPAGNSTFTGWSGNCSGTGACSLALSSSKIAIATFTSAGPFIIKVSTGGTGSGYITSSPSGLDCGSTRTVCSASFSADTSITLSAFAVERSTFAGWSNAGCSGTSTCVILSTSAQQSTGGKNSPSAWFY